MFAIALEVWAAVATACALYFFREFKRSNNAGYYLFRFMHLKLGYSTEQLISELNEFEDEETD